MDGISSRRRPHSTYVALLFSLLLLPNYVDNADHSTYMAIALGTATVRSDSAPFSASPSIASPLVSGKGTSLPSSAVDEGVQRTGADRWHDAGFTGRGVKIGIIDESFNRYGEYLADANVTTKSFRSSGLIESPVEPNFSLSDRLHGTACAEIVHAMAPDAALFLATIDGNGRASFVEALDWLTTTAGVSIVSISEGWDTFFPKDGTSQYSQAVDRARAAGVFVAVGAGNSGSGWFGSGYGEGHYSATFLDHTGDGYHDFAQTGEPTKNSMAVRIANRPVHVMLTWDHAPMGNHRYELVLYNANGREVDTGHLRVSLGIGLSNGNYLSGTYPSGTYTLRVRKREQGAPNVAFEMFFGGAQFEQTMPSSSLLVPADARGAVTVGEADSHTDQIVPSSSRGPTQDGRSKPDLVAPSCVTSATYSAIADPIFCGTSAATPHVAGAAALYKQAFPSASPDDILAYLQQHAQKLQGTDGDPNTSGAGRLDLGPPP